ncbi:DUF5076 domain-containing protein [Brevundimonas staleyi]|uniref:DUF5076 domain-containing protein n=1 Tax=Brevundimonas staleyi TaxID=74326 RepID=A0ABW0FR19_9CAUL
MTHPYALPEPDEVGAVTDGSAVELTRVWIGPQGPAIICRPAFDDPSTMGEMLAELCWHFAYAYEKNGGFTQEEAKALLKEGWARGHANGEAAAAAKASK